MKSLKKYGIDAKTIHYQWTPEQLVQESVKQNLGRITASGALAINTGKFTGRSPKDRFIVKDAITEHKVWWDGEVNIPFDSDKFDKLYDKMVQYASSKELYVRDAFVTVVTFRR